MYRHNMSAVRLRFNLDDSNNELTVVVRSRVASADRGESGALWRSPFLDFHNLSSMPITLCLLARFGIWQLISCFTCKHVPNSETAR